MLTAAAATVSPPHGNIRRPATAKEREEEEERVVRLSVRPPGACVAGGDWSGNREKEIGRGNGDGLQE